MEKDLQKNTYICMYNGITLLYTWNIVNQLHFSLKYIYYSFIVEITVWTYEASAQHFHSQIKYNN